MGRTIDTQALRKTIQAASVPTIGIALVAGLAIAIHVTLGTSLPPQWDDEAYFIVPALQMKHSGDLGGAMLLVDHGLFWLPPLMYFVNCGFLMLLGDGMFAIRTAALVETLLCLPLFYFLAKKIAPEHTLLCRLLPIAAWAICLPVIVMANIGRPEALSTLLNLSALLAIASKRTTGGIAIAILSLLCHPLLAAPALAIIALAIVKRQWQRPKVWELMLLALAATLLLGEAMRLYDSWNEYIRQYQYQLHRKNSRAVSPTTVFFALVMAFSFGYGVFSGHKKANAPQPIPEHTYCILFCSCSVFVAAYGQEIWYLSLTMTAYAILALVATAPLSRRQGLLLNTAFASLVVAVWGFCLHWDRYLSFSIRPSSVAAVQRHRNEIRDYLRTFLRTHTGSIVVTPYLYTDMIDLGGYARTYSYIPAFSTEHDNLAYYIDYRSTQPWMQVLPSTAMLIDYDRVRIDRRVHKDGYFDDTIEVYALRKKSAPKP